MCLRYVTQHQPRGIIYTHCVFAGSERFECYIIRRPWVVQLYFSFTGIAAQLQLRSPIFSVTSQSSSELTKMASAVDDATTSIAVLVPTGNQHYHLHPFLVSGEESNETIANRLLALSTSDQTGSFPHLRKGYRFMTMRRLVFGKVVLSGVRRQSSKHTVNKD
jgi:hypothetical protein